MTHFSEMPVETFLQTPFEFVKNFDTGGQCNYYKVALRHAAPSGAKIDALHHKTVRGLKLELVKRVQRVTKLIIQYLALLLHLVSNFEETIDEFYVLSESVREETNRLRALIMAIRITNEFFNGKSYYMVTKEKKK